MNSFSPNPLIQKTYTFGFHQDFPATLLTISAGALSLAARRVGEAAGDASEEAKKMAPLMDARHGPSSFEARSMRQTAELHRRLAFEMSYLSRSRLSFIPPHVEIALSLDASAAAQFIEASRGKPFKIGTISYGHGWFENIADAVEPHVPPEEYRSLAAGYAKRSSSVPFLTAEFDDPVQKAASLAALGKSAFGRHLIGEAAAFQCTTSFIDLKAYNIVSSDAGSYNVGALFQSRFPHDDIYVDTFASQSPLHKGIKTAHEYGHLLQCRKHSGPYAGADDLDAFEASVKPHLSTLEAHSIAVEFIVASELLAEGADPSDVKSALSFPCLDATTVNLISHDPQRFILELSQSQTLRTKWHLEKEQCQSSPELATSYAHSLIPLCAPWKAMRYAVSSRSHSPSLPTAVGSLLPSEKQDLG